MKTYLEITIPVGEKQREILLPSLIEFGCEAFQDTEAALLCYADRSGWTDLSYQSFKDRVTNPVRAISSAAVVQFRDIRDENWNEQWEKTIQPIEVGQNIVIKPSWCAYENNDERIVIQIDPKMSFGTGYHETTRLILAMLERYVSPQSRMLDVGTGTGILAIASIKLGAGSAVGIDNDEWSIANAIENVDANQSGGRMQILDSTLDTFPSFQFDLIAANLMLNILLAMTDEFRRLLRPGGVLLLSGLLASDRETVMEHLDTKRFFLIEERAEREWIALAARRLS